MRKASKPYYVLGALLKKICHISPMYLPICFFHALLGSLYPLSMIYFPSRIIDLLVDGADLRQLALYVSLCVALPALLSVFKTLTKQKADSLSIQIENELQLSVNTAMTNAKYNKLEDPQVYLQLQKLQDGQNMAGKVTHTLQNNLGGILQYLLGLLIYIPLMIRLVRSDKISKLHSFSQQLPPGLFRLCSNTIVIFLLVMLIFLLYIYMKGSLQQKQYRLVESFSHVERAYRYYVKLRSDYECGADIRLNRLSDMLRAYTEKYNLSERKMHFSIGRFNGLSDVALAILTRIQYIVIYGYIILKIICGAITIGEFYLYTNALLQSLDYMRGIVSNFTDLKLALSYYDSYPALWKASETDKEPDKPVISTRLPGEIVFENVSFRYQEHDRWILQELNLTIKAGEHIALVGKNGAGKSTLVKLLTGLYPLEKGHIYLHGKDIQGLSREELFSYFGAVFQDSRLLAATIAENLAADSYDNADLPRIQRILRVLGLYERLGEDGISLPVSRRLSENGVIFSGGEEQKLVIGRALYKNAPIAVMDEPMASLDPIAEREINILVSKLLEGITTLIISHRLSTCVMCDRIIVLEDGKVVEEGTHEELLARGGTYRAMWEAQAKYYQE